MAFTHLSLLKLADPATADQVIALVAEQATTFAGALTFEAVPNLAPNKAYDLVFVSVFETEDDYRTYLDHPAHHELSSKVRPFLESATGLDYVLSQGAS